MTSKTLYKMHRAGTLYPLAHNAITRAIADKQWGRVASLAVILQHLEGPVIDPEQDIDTICDDGSLALLLLSLLVEKVI